MKLVGPVADDDHYPVHDLLAADEEGHQVAGRAVGPVSVLDDDHHGPGLGQALEQRQHLLEQPRPGDSRVRLHVCLAELRQQPGELAGGVAGQQPRDTVGSQVADKLPEHGGERHKGRPSAPRSRQLPASTRAPASPATAANSLTIRDLPIPASPPMSTADGEPARARSRAASRAARYSARPTRTGLLMRALMSSRMPSAGDTPGGATCLTVVVTSAGSHARHSPASGYAGHGVPRWPTVTAAPAWPTVTAPPAAASPGPAPRPGPVSGKGAPLPPRVGGRSRPRLLKVRGKAPAGDWSVALSSAGYRRPSRWRQLAAFDALQESDEAGVVGLLVVVHGQVAAVRQER